jgi:hypothetical protein
MNRYYTWVNAKDLVNVIIPNKDSSYFYSKQFGWKQGYSADHIVFLCSNIKECHLVPDTLTRLLGVPLCTFE